MANPNELPVIITGDNQSLMNSLQKATDDIKNFAKQGSNSIAGFENPLSSVTSQLGSLSAASLGAAGAVGAIAVVLGLMWKVGSDSVQKTDEFGESMEKLQRVMGGSAQQVGELAMALKRENIDADTYLGYMAKTVKGMDLLISKHPELRAQLTDSHGKAKSLADIQGVLAQRFLDATPGVDRQRVAIEQWGRAGTNAARDNIKVIEALEDNKKVLSGLGLEYGKIQKLHEDYEQAEKRLTVAHEAQSLMIGSVLMPIWIELKNALGSMTTNTIPALVGAFQAFAVGIILTVGSLKNAFLMLKLEVEPIVLAISNIIQFDYNAMHGNFRKAGQNFLAGFTESAHSVKSTLQEMKQNAIDTANSVGKILDNKPLEHAKTDSNVSGGNLTTPGKDKESALEAVKARLEKERALYEMSGIYELDSHGNILKKKAEADQVNRTYTKEMEAKFLADELANFDGTEKDKQKLTSMRWTTDREVMKQAWAAKLVMFDNEIKAQTQSNAEAIRLAKEKAEQILQYEGGNKQSADYQKALGEVVTLEKKAAQQIEEVRIAKDEIVLKSLIAEKDAEIIAINHQVDMGNISELKGLKQIQDIENKKFEIEKAALTKRLNLRKQEGDLGIKEAIRIEGQLAQLESTHTAKIIQIENKRNKTIQAGWKTLFASIKTEMNKSIQGMILGTTTLSGALDSIWNTMKSSFAQMAADQLMVWIGLEESKTVVSEQSALQILATEIATSLKKVAIWVWSGIKYIAIQAWQAAAGAYNALVSIPYVGPILAPIAAAVALAAIMKMVSSIASARGGYDIKPGENPMTQLHEKEMVLPAEHADTIRSLKGDGLTRAILASNAQILQTMARSQSSVDKYNRSAPTQKAPVRSQSMNLTVQGFVGSERQLAQTLKNVLNKDARLYGTA